MATSARRVPLMLVLAIFVLPTVTLATEYVVGDDAGWSTSVSYTAWAAGKTFYVGDVLVFKYGEGEDNVVKVDGKGFAECTTSPNSGVLISGNDRVTLATTGNKWYICGVRQHCYIGQKLKITVWPKMMFGAPEPVENSEPVGAPWSPPESEFVGASWSPMESEPVGSPWSPPEPEPVGAPWNWNLWKLLGAR